MIKYDRVTRPNPHDDEDEEAEEYEREDGRGLRRSAAPAARGVKEEDGEVGNRERLGPFLNVIHLKSGGEGGLISNDNVCLCAWVYRRAGGSAAARGSVRSRSTRMPPRMMTQATTPPHPSSTY